MKRSTLSVALLLLLLGVLSAYTYLNTVPAACGALCGEQHRAIMDGTANSPYRYRVLPAYAATLFMPDTSAAGVMVGYALAHFIAFPALAFAFYAWLRRWHTTTNAVIGVLILTALMPIMLRVWGLSLSTPLEGIFLCLGLILLHRQPHGFTPAFLLLIVAAAFNRETAILLPLAYATTQLSRWRERDYWLRGALFGMAWAAVFIGLRFALGNAPDDVPLAEAWRLNTLGEWHSQEAVFKNLFFLPLWWLYFKQVRCAPAFLQRLAPVALVYLVLFLAFGFWNEVRLHIPLLILTLPVALRAIKLQPAR